MRVAVLATRDTKVAEARYLAARIEAEHCEVELVDTTPSMWADPAAYQTRAELMAAAGDALRDALLPRVVSGELAGVCIIAGASGAALAAPLICALPYGLPKLLVSPIVSSDIRPYIGSSDTIVVSPVVDFTGRNDYVDFALARAATIVCALVRGDSTYPDSGATHYAATAFGVTSRLALELGKRLAGRGNRLAVFSANGAGGESFEHFVERGLVCGALDLTLSELADELCGGALSAGAQRGWAAVKAQMPIVMAPGGVDFINYGVPASVPPERRARKIVEHTPSVTLVRTSPEENFTLGRMVGERAAAAADRAVVLVPRSGFSLLSRPEGPFWDPEADDAFLQGLRAIPNVRIEHVDDEINGMKMIDVVMSITASWRTE